MELYYNPEQMGEGEIKGTFVARHWLLDELLSIVRGQPKGAGVQHAIIVGPRGIGKTTMLLMLRFGIRESELGKQWLPVRFPEESYSINDLADFWLATMSNLAYERSDTTLISTADTLKREYADAGSLSDAAIAALKDWCRRRKLRLILLVDNIDMVLNQINDTIENSRLREVLMNDGTFMLVGTATSFFKEARKYDQPLYNFFRIYNLDSLNCEEIDKFLRQRAAVDNRMNFDEWMKQNQARIRVLHYFTGGNPRLILMLYHIIANSEIVEVRRGIEKLLDEVTPYYKAKVEGLPPQQRKILDYVARVSGRTHEGLTPTQIAQDARLPVNQVSAQLKRLSDLGYVRAANIRAKNSFYSLAEPLYAIWHQMRFGRESRQRMEWLIEFLKGWYSNQEIVEQTQRLVDRFAELFKKGEANAALDTLEYRRYLSAAMHPHFRRGVMDRLLCDYLDAGKSDQVREILRESDRPILSVATVERLTKDGFVTREQLRLFRERREDLVQQLKHVVALIKDEDWQQVISVLDGIREVFLQSPELWFVRATALDRLDRKREALQDFDAGLAIVYERYAALEKTRILFKLNDYRAAIEACDCIVNKDPDAWNAHITRAACLVALGKFDEAVLSAKLGASGGRRAKRALQCILTLEDTPENRFIAPVFTRAFDDARLAWHQLVNAATTEEARSKVTSAITTCMQPDSIAFLRALIRETNLDDVLFPISRALDYLLTGDRNIVEKLSAEVRPIVDEIISDYEKKQSAPDRHRRAPTKRRRLSR